jgi:hypothetical protein
LENGKLKSELGTGNEGRNLMIYSVEVKDISLTDYIQVRHAVYLPHTAGRFAKKQFKKAQMPIVERLVDRYDLEYK